MLCHTQPHAGPHKRFSTEKNARELRASCSPAPDASQRRRIHRSAERSGEQPFFSGGVATALKRIATMAGHSLGTMRAKRRGDQFNGFVSVWQYTTAVVCRAPPIQHTQRGLSVSRHTQDLKGSSALPHNSAVRRTPELPTCDRASPRRTVDRSASRELDVESDNSTLVGLNRFCVDWIGHKMST